MEGARATRLAMGVALAVLVAAVAYPLAGTTAAVITLLGAVTAALVSGTGRGDRKGEVEPATRDDPPLDELLDALVSPVLLIRDGRVAHANAPARTLLGAHIVGEDVRVALRHPAATERLAAAHPAPADRPVELVGLGTLDQRWLMRIGEASDGTRIVHLADETGHHATERMRVDFVANASHELRTPLASILGFAETLADEAGEDPALRTRFLGIMAAEARRMQRLVEDLLSLSRIESDKHRL
ncbi:MAG TPA: histidine kinase dimerization/phospho-acceptor domain-containing protein, partial [Sphingomonas sp.]